MNILYLATHLNIGGISSYICSLSCGMKARGHMVYVASSGGQLRERLLREGVACPVIPIRTKSEAHAPKILASLVKTVMLVREKNIDIVHSNTRVTQVLGSLVHEVCGLPHVSTCHGFFKKRFSRALFPCWGERVIAISEAVKDHLIHDFRVPEKNIVTIHNGIDMSRFRSKDLKPKAALKKELGLRDEPVIGIVARLSEVKGHVYLIEAMKAVLEKIPGAYLLIVGEGVMEKQLKDLASSLGIARNTLFFPSVENTADILPAMDVFVMPSLKEGLGLSLMEAMAVGLPVVGSNVGGIKSLIQHGRNGLLVESADSKGLAEALLEVLSHPEKAWGMGESARMDIQQNYSAETMVLETERAYLECINAKY